MITEDLFSGFVLDSDRPHRQEWTVCEEGWTDPQVVYRRGDHWRCLCRVFQLDRRCSHVDLVLTEPDSMLIVEGCDSGRAVESHRLGGATC